MPALLSPCSAEGSQTTPGIWVIRVCPGQRGHVGWLCRTWLPVWEAPGHTMPHCSSGRAGPGRRCQLFWVPGEDLDLLAVSIFLRGKVSGSSLGGKSAPSARIPKASRLPFQRREGQVCVAPGRGPLECSALSHWSLHCSQWPPTTDPRESRNPRLSAPGLGAVPQHRQPGNETHGTPNSAFCPGIK